MFQDPTELSKFNLAEFYHLKKGLKVTSEGRVTMIATKRETEY